MLSLIYTFVFVLADQPSGKDKRKKNHKIVLIAGEKSHPAGIHEYIKTVRLIKTMLDRSNEKGLSTEVHLHGWPENEKTLNNADLILFVSDGCDGYNFDHVPFMTEKRMKVMEKQLKRGCGISLIHFSTFADHRYGQRMLEWSGGYFDWQDSSGARHNYSALKEIESTVYLASPSHQISSGVKPFLLKEEVYYKMRFPQEKRELVPIALIPGLNSGSDWENVVSWAFQRTDGGRAFCSTMNHYYPNWQNENYRKLMLNGIVWAAGSDVPLSGVQTEFYSDKEVTSHIYSKSIKGLMIGDRTANGAWTESCLPLKQAIEKDKRILIDLSSNINDIWQYDLNDYQFIILNKKDTSGINSYSKTILEEYLSKGNGLIAIPFFQKAKASGKSGTWVAYKEIFRREFTHDALPVKLEKRPRIILNHFITRSIASIPKVNFAYPVTGETKVEKLVDSEFNLPILWTYSVGKGRVVQTSLPLDKELLNSKEISELIRRSALWVSFRD